MVAMMGAYGTVAAAQTSTAKVVIIVGADTPQYISRANEVYAEAIKYTPNVVKVYSPNATWSAVKSAVNGANVVVYIGHGNGCPEPVSAARTATDEGRVRPQRQRRRTVTAT